MSCSLIQIITDCKLTLQFILVANLLLDTDTLEKFALCYVSEGPTASVIGVEVRKVGRQLFPLRSWCGSLKRRQQTDFFMVQAPESGFSIRNVDVGCGTTLHTTLAIL
jgi:hypothetical protein